MAKKLFELLVVEGQLKTQAQTTRTDLRNTFEKKRHLFEEKRKTFQSSEEGSSAPVVEEQSDIQTTIPGELAWLAGIWTKAIDTSYAVAEGNTRARADVTLDTGAVLLANVPATALLELEKRVAEIHEVLLAVPTLDPAKGFRSDPDKGKDIYRARDVTKARTKKVEEFVVVVPVTEHHPAQVVKVTKDVSVGTITEQEWSAMVTPAQKSRMLERAEELRRAVKAALHRANAVEMDTLPTCGTKVFDYVLKD